jgi:hypothetical protein
MLDILSRKLLLHDHLDNHAIEETHMADPPRYPGTPRWVKVFGIILLVVVLLFLILLFTRGPHRGASDHTPPSGVNHTPPGGGVGGRTPP